MIEVEANQLKNSDERTNQFKLKVNDANITVIPNTTGHKVEHISNYGQLAMVDISTSANTYITTKSTQAQKSIQIYHCIINTMTKEGQTKILPERVTTQ